ncbi:MAG: exo-alpha-sialidase [Bacteroidota bacterium]
MIIIIGVASCNKDDEPEEDLTYKDPVTGARIAWDFSSSQRLAPVSRFSSTKYTSYPRMIEVQNGDFLCVFEADHNIDIVRSGDKGESWTRPVRISSAANGMNRAVPEIIQLGNGDIIVPYDLRPDGSGENTILRSIALKISKDNGLTWSEEQVVYTIDYVNDNGCAEPNIIELPGGELHLYFANQNDFPSTHEQNITMFRSLDNGETWIDKKVVSYSETSRDGMPVAIYQDDTDEIIMVIEDNHQHNFKPAIIRTGNYWGNAPVGRTSDRVYALDHDQNSSAYQGAPYIRKMPAGNIALSYQGTEDRGGDELSNSTMYVEVGDKTGRAFTHKTEPFVVPLEKNALWNSLSVMDGKVWALTATTAYSDSKREIWTIEGYEIDDYIIPYGGIEQTHARYPFFVGHKSNTNVGVDVAYDDEYLYLKALVQDEAVFDSDGVVFSIDPKNISSTTPAKNIFSFTVRAGGELVSQEGFNGSWEKMNLELQNFSVNKTETGYTIEIPVPWKNLGGKPAADTRIGFTISLIEYTGENSLAYIEHMVFSNGHQPHTWGSMRIIP